MKKEQIIELHNEGRNAEYIGDKVGSTIQCVRAVISQHKRLEKAKEFSKQQDELRVKAEAQAEPIQVVAPTEIKGTVNSTFDLKALIPEPNKDYIPRKLGCGMTDLALIEKMYETRYTNKNPRFPLLLGETGSGKTVLASTFAGKIKKAYRRLNLCGATAPEDLIGQFIQTDKGIVWVDGWLTSFMRHGGILVLDELNMCPPEILTILNSVADSEKTLVLTGKDGEIIKAHEDFWLVGTMNPNYEGTKEMNTALKDRFREISIPYCTAVERKLGIDKKFLEVVAKLRKSEAITRPVSTRDLINYKEDCKDINKDVATFFFINRFDDTEQKVVAEIIDLTLNGDDSENKEGDSENE